MDMSSILEPSGDRKRQLSREGAELAKRTRRFAATGFAYRDAVVLLRHRPRAFYLDDAIRSRAAAFPLRTFFASFAPLRELVLRNGRDELELPRASAQAERAGRPIDSPPAIVDPTPPLYRTQNTSMV
jgi:hypothetical protein